MTDADLERLHNRVFAGEDATGDLWAIRNESLPRGIDAKRAEALSDMWNGVLLGRSSFPRLEAAKALVETALAADTSYPILTNDGWIYDKLSPGERKELVQYIEEQLRHADAPLAMQVLREFADDLAGEGPHY